MIRRTVFALVAFMLQPAIAEAQIVVSNGNTVATPNRVVTFSDTSAPFYPSATPYSEAGTTVRSVNTGIDSGLIVTRTNSGEPFWYPNGGHTGFFEVAFNEVIDAVQLQVGSGFSRFSGPTPPALYYDFLLDGASVGSGKVSGPPLFTSDFNFANYGFSGTAFDTMELQVRNDGGASFDPMAVDVGAFDSIAFMSSAAAVPEPASWAMMIGGFGLLGGMMRRRYRKSEQHFTANVRAIAAA